MPLNSISLRAVRVILLFAVLLGSSTSFAYETWSEDPDTDTGNCATCHGKFGFVMKKYVSMHDQTIWTGDLMTGHGSSMLIGCLECHQLEGDEPLLGRCAGCHGREEDGGPLQKSAGLVQRHNIKGFPTCMSCHVSNDDIVGENVVPAGESRKGIDSCNDAQFGPDGLDDDGDGLTDGEDPDCQKKN